MSASGNIINPDFGIRCHCRAQATENAPISDPAERPLSPMERASLLRMFAHYGASPEKLQRVFGRSRRVVLNAIRQRVIVMPDPRGPVETIPQRAA